MMVARALFIAIGILIALSEYALIVNDCALNKKVEKNDSISKILLFSFVLKNGNLQFKINSNSVILILEYF